MHFVGQPPMHYLAQWRMQIASGLLSSGAASVAAIARDVGYESEAAFSRAFKKLVGVAPATSAPGAQGDGARDVNARPCRRGESKTFFGEALAEPSYGSIVRPQACDPRAPHGPAPDRRHRQCVSLARSGSGGGGRRVAD